MFFEILQRQGMKIVQNIKQSKKKTPITAPNTVPSYSSILKCDNYNLLEQFIDKYIYVWLKTNNAFWMYPTEVNDNYVKGFAWDIFGWREIGFSISAIDSFY